MGHFLNRLSRFKSGGHQFGFDIRPLEAVENIWPVGSERCESLEGSRSPPGSADIGMAKSDNQSSDVNLKHMVRGRDERNHDLLIRRLFRGSYVTD